MSLPGRELPVSSWNELISVLHSRDLVQTRPDEGDHLRSPYVFRGMDVATWELETSLQRLPKKPNKPQLIERSLIRNFRKYASAGAFDTQSEWYVLAVAQHNGLPTRCLDWTASPLVAAHFACGDENYKNEDGAIWCVHSGILRDLNKRLNPDKAGSLSGSAWVYDTRILESSFENLDALDQTLTNGQLLLLWEPPSLDSRIANQFGLLSLMNDVVTSQTHFLNQHCEEYPDLVVRIILTAEMKSETRDMLDQSNISERTLFPGLPGLCSWLKRYYSTAW